VPAVTAGQRQLWTRKATWASPVTDAGRFCDICRVTGLTGFPQCCA
jgi:hypothetical protein